MAVAGNQPQTFASHLQELQLRLMSVGFVFLAASLVAFIFRAQIASWLQAPLHSPLYYHSPSGAFSYVVQVSVACGLLACLPFALYNLIRFIEPAFNSDIQRRRGKIVRTILISTVFIVIGGSFGYYLMLPITLHFFNSYASSQVNALITTDEYINFAIACILTFAVIFQMPLAIGLIDNFKPIKPAKLLHYQRHVIVISLVVALVLPFTYDPLTQFIIALPIIVLYYVSIAWLYLRHSVRPVAKSRRKTIKSAQPSPSTPPAKFKQAETPTTVQPSFQLVQPEVRPTKTKLKDKHESKLGRSLKPHVVIQSAQGPRTLDLRQKSK